MLVMTQKQNINVRVGVAMKMFGRMVSLLDKNVGNAREVIQLADLQISAELCEVIQFYYEILFIKLKSIIQTQGKFCYVLKNIKRLLRRYKIFEFLPKGCSFATITKYKYNFKILIWNILININTGLRNDQKCFFSLISIIIIYSKKIQNMGQSQSPLKKIYYICPTCGRQVWTFPPYVGSPCWKCPDVNFKKKCQSCKKDVDMWEISFQKCWECQKSSWREYSKFRRAL